MSSQLNTVDSPWRFGWMSPIARPFRHFQIAQVLDEELAGRLLDWLETTPNFLARNENFYRSSAFHVSPRTAPPALEKFFSVRNFQALRGIMSESFELPFADRVILSANRYGPGQGTLIHTDHQLDDRRDGFSFTHRFLLYLNQGWEPAEGGALGLFDGPEPSNLAATLQPMHNSGVALEISPNSYHAVAAVRSGQRYSLNFTFSALERL
jgi:Rps23 Pro-64 3,4-dihydroxylase Tpa1-like proline 4-hydroxylase